MTRKTAVVLAVTAMLIGCDGSVMSKAQGEARIALWRECMEMAAKIPRQADDDVHKIVESCSEQAAYMSYARR